MNKVIIGFESFDNIRDNSRAFFEFLYKYYSDRFDFVYFLFRNPYIQEENVIEMNNLKVIYADDDDFETEFNKIDIIISSFTNGLMYKKPYQTWINVWHGVGGSKKIVFLDENTLAPPINFFENVDYFITTSELMKVIYASAFNIPTNKIMLLGQPRNDYLFTSNSSEILENKFNICLSNYRKVILYMPTFRKTFFRDDGVLNGKNFINLHEYDENKLINYLRLNNYLLLIKLHPSEEYEIPYSDNEHIKILNKEVFKKERIEPTEIYTSIDLLVTDYSSAHSDYLLLEKPVLFVHTDSEEYNKKRGILFNDYDLWFPGPKVKKVDEFITEIDKLFVNSAYYKNERQRYNRLINNNDNLNSSENCERLANFIFEKILDENKSERNDLYKKIYELTNELKNKGSELINKSIELDHKNKELNKNENYIKQINNDLRSKEIELFNLNIELNQIKNELQNKEIELNQKNQELTIKDTDLNNKISDLIQKVQALSIKEDELNRVTFELQKLKNEYKNKNDQIENILDSKSFKLAKRMASIYRMIKLKKNR